MSTIPLFPTATIWKQQMGGLKKKKKCYIHSNLFLKVLGTRLSDPFNKNAKCPWLPGKWDLHKNNVWFRKEKINTRKKKKNPMRVSKNIKTMFPGSSLSILQEPSGFPPKCICTCTRTYTHITPSPKPECHHVSTYSTGILEQSLHRFGTRSQVALLVPRRFLLARNFQEENGTSLVARLTGSGGTLSLLGRSATRL